MYRCPSCEQSLILENNMLKRSEGPFKKSVTKSEGRCNESQDLVQHIPLLEEFLNLKNSDSKESERLINLKKRSETLKEKIDHLNSLNLDSETELLLEVHDLKTELESAETELENVMSKKSEESLVMRRLERKREELKSLNSDTIIVNVDIQKIRDDISKLSRNIEKILIKMKDNEEMRHNLSKYKEYLRYKESIEKLKLKRDSYKLEINKVEKKQSQLLLLRDKSNQAEVLALESTVDNINIYAKIYLDMMFTEPMIVNIENFKQSKTSSKTELQCKMNTTIYYKGSEYDNVEQLSGGERQKCELAFELAVNSIMGGDMLLLDECINNLDSEFNTDILVLLRTFAQEHNKSIIVVSHECVTGLFDEVYTV